MRDFFGEKLMVGDIVITATCGSIGTHFRIGKIVKMYPTNSPIGTDRIRIEFLDKNRNVAHVVIHANNCVLIDPKALEKQYIHFLLPKT